LKEDSVEKVLSDIVTYEVSRVWVVDQVGKVGSCVSIYDILVALKGAYQNCLWPLIEIGNFKLRQTLFNFANTFFHLSLLGKVWSRPRQKVKRWNILVQTLVSVKTDVRGTNTKQ